MSAIQSRVEQLQEIFHSTFCIRVGPMWKYHPIQQEGNALGATEAYGLRCLAKKAILEKKSGRSWRKSSKNWRRINLWRFKAGYIVFGIDVNSDTRRRRFDD